jgi:lysophospholipase
VSDNQPGTFNRRAIPADASETEWRAADGWLLRRIDWNTVDHATPPRGSLLFLPGRGDAYEKYLETLDYWHRRGWRVTAADWRGQAGSGRLGNDAVTGHIGDFAQWVDDLARFWADWKASTPGPHVLAGHSMGGQIVLRAVAERRVNPDAVVLSAPMLGLRNHGFPAAMMHGVAKLMCMLGDPRRPAWKWSEKPGQVPEGRELLLTHDAARYADELFWRDARPQLVMGPGSWGWVERAYASTIGLQHRGVLESVQTPVFVVATSDDGLVDYGAIRRAVSRLPHGELLTFGREARHEILREVDPIRDAALAAINSFLDRAAPRRD